MASYLNKFFATKDGKRISKLARESSTFNIAYGYWRDALFERVMRLFVIDTNGEVLPKEIESRLLLNGHCGITAQVDGKLTAVFGSFYGSTKYQDEFTNYNWWTPIKSGNFEIGKDGVVINNNALRNPIYHMIHNYAIMLGHTEVTLIDALINARQKNIPVASTETEIASIKDYQEKLFNGVYGQVKDPAFLGIEFKDPGRDTANLKDIYEIRRNILYSFYEDIGIKTNYEKRENMTTAEVGANNTLLLLNLSDMLDSRKRGFDEVNKMFGTNWSVDLVDVLKYTEDDTKGVDVDADNGIMEE